MANLGSKGSSINVNFKVGLFSVRNGYMNFKQFNPDGTTYGKKADNKAAVGDGSPLRSNTYDTLSIKDSLPYDKYSMIGSIKAHDLSVRTPSVSGVTYAQTMATTATGTTGAYV